MPKRGNGKGSIQQRGERYVAVLTLSRDTTGKQQRKTARLDSYQQAEAWLKRQVAEPSQIPTGSTDSDSYATSTRRVHRRAPRTEDRRALARTWSATFGVSAHAPARR